MGAIKWHKRLEIEVIAIEPYSTIDAKSLEVGINSFLCLDLHMSSCPLEMTWQIFFVDSCCESCVIYGECVYGWDQSLTVVCTVCMALHDELMLLLYIYTFSIHSVPIHFHCRVGFRNFCLLW